MDYDEYTGKRRGGPAPGGPDERSRRNEDPPRDEETIREEHSVPGEKLLSFVKKIVRQGNVRRITIKSEEGRTLLEIPLSVGLVGAWLAPTFAAVGAVAALVTNCSIVVERVRERPGDGEEGGRAG